ncbi:hypothetical protein DFH06DRAFT_1351608 [Mycena polygramma]|nr:hypothetical protein DFH06DRAFT_1351608 [Mycena polygramma]
MANFPQELIDETIDFLHDEPPALRACATVAKCWTPAAQLHLFSRLTAKSTARVNAVADGLSGTALGRYVLSVHIVFPVPLPPHPEDAGEDERFVFALIDLFAEMPRVQELVIQACRPSRWQWTGAPYLVSMGERQMTREFYPPSCFLQLLDGVISRDFFKSLTFINWDFPHAEILPIVDALPELLIKCCRLGTAATFPGVTSYPGVWTVPYSGQMQVGKLSVEECTGWVDFQHWIARSIKTTHLAISTDDDCHLSHDVLNGLECIEYSLQLDHKESAEVLPSLAALVGSVGIPCKRVGIYIETLLDREGQGGLETWLTLVRIRADQELRIELVLMEPPGMRREELEREIVDGCRLGCRFNRPLGLVLVESQSVWQAGVWGTLSLLFKGCRN